MSAAKSWATSDMPTPEVPDTEVLEALVRTAMAAHAAIKPRGFDSQRDRRRLHMRIDDLLDQLANPAAVIHLEPIEFHVDARDCGICGRRRYINFSGAICCLACDGHPMGKWVGMDGEVAS